jgi:hypothetical protein
MRIQFPNCIFFSLVVCSCKGGVFDVLPALKDGDSCFQRLTSETENVLCGIRVTVVC